MRKGQVEFIVVLGVIIVAVVAVLLASQTLRLPGPVSAEQKAVRDSLERLIQTTAADTIDALSRFGGHPSPPASGVTFLGKDVPLWSSAGVSQIPDVRTNVVRLLEQQLNENKDSFISGLEGVSVGTASVTANILDSKMVLTVNIPATLRGQPVPPRYDVEVQTKFGEALQFAEDFIREQSKNRYLEYSIMASLLASPLENDQFSTPLYVRLTRCGDFYYASWFDLRPKVQQRVETTLAHLYMPGKAPISVGDITPYPKYVLPRLGGKEHADLEVSFHLPDDFQLQPASFQVSPSPIMAMASPIGFTGICTSDPIYVNYFLSFPVIVRVRDPLTQSILQFGQHTFIKDNAPGQWQDPALYQQSQQQLLCSDLQCPVSLQVAGLDSSGVPDADVTYLGCSLGKTDNQGALQGLAPCGTGPLQIAKQGYAFYQDVVPANDLAAKKVTIVKQVSPTIFVYEASVANNTLTAHYVVNSVSPLQPGNRLILTFRSLTSPAQVFTRVFSSPTGTLQSLQADSYLVSGTLMKEDVVGNKKTLTFQGSFTATAHLLEDVGDLHLIVPTSLDFAALQEQNDISVAAIIYSSLLANCNAGPMSATAPDETAFPCAKAYSEV